MRPVLLAASALIVICSGSPASAQVPGKLPSPLGKPTPKLPTGPVLVKPKPAAKPKITPRPTTTPILHERIKPGVVFTPAAPPVKGDPSCRRGDPDCNPCTSNVQAQFRKIKEGRARWTSKPWRFEWGKHYAPNRIRPYEAFDEDSPEADTLGLSHSHPQAFVRTNAGPSWYAGTHSAPGSDRPGTVFIIEQAADGKKSLAALHRTRTGHPNGLHVLGKYLLFAERPDRARPDQLRVIDLGRRSRVNDITHEVPEATGEAKSWKQFGGGLGTAKLSDGSYLLISSLPGDRKASRRFHQFYNMKGNLGVTSGLTMRLLHVQQFRPTAKVPSKYQYSEHLSLVTECGTGDIYAFHSSGDGEAIDGLIGRGYWRMSKLVSRDGKPELDPIDVHEIQQNTDDCHMRSAASVGVGPNGKLELLCHQYRKDPDPSVANPFSFNTSGNDAWRFRAGVPN